MTMPTIPRILATTALCLAAVGVNCCQQTKGIEYWKEMEPIEEGEEPIFDYFPLDGQE